MGEKTQVSTAGLVIASDLQVTNQIPMTTDPVSLLIVKKTRGLLIKITGELLHNCKPILILCQ